MKRLMIAAVCLFGLALGANGALSADGTTTPLGFFLPVNWSSISTCGVWQGRPSPNGCYNFGDVYHTGIDLMANEGTKVRAIADGVVQEPINGGWGSGNIAVIIEHRMMSGETFRVIYGHVRNVTKNKGASVKAGEVFAEVGDWYDTQDHLHLGVIAAGRSAPVNPSSYGRWLDRLFGTDLDIAGNKTGYYDNGLIDPNGFSVSHFPDNYLSRENMREDSLVYPIERINPWFYKYCVDGNDSRCDQEDREFYMDCFYGYERYYWCYIASGSGGGGSGGDNPPPSTSLPDLEIEEITVHRTPEEGDSTRLTEETSLMNVGQTYQANIWPVSKKENCQNGNTTGNEGFEVKTDVFYKYARSEDEGEWKLLKRSETHCKYMDEDNSKKEMITFTVPVDAAGKRLYLKAKVDATQDIAETDEGNNWSDIEWYPIRGACDLVITSGSLTAGRITLSQGESYGFKGTVLNLGPDSCPSDTRLSYFYKKPGDTDWRYADGDDTPASKLLPNQSNEEWMTTDTLVADIPGAYQARICADTNTANQETNETNNCFEFSYTVFPPPSSTLVVTDPPAGAVWRCSRKNDYQYIRWNGVTYAQSPTVELWYSLDDGASWRLIGSAISNDGKSRWFMCTSPIGKDSAYGRVRVIARYGGQTFIALSGRFYVDYARGCK